jgi:carbonic anhydrase
MASAQVCSARADTLGNTVHSTPGRGPTLPTNRLPAMTPFASPHPPARRWAHRPLAALGLAGLLALTMGQPSRAAEPAAVDPAAKALGDQVREALHGDASKKRLTLVINGKEKILPPLPAKAPEPAHAEPAPPPTPAVAPARPQPSAHLRARTAAVIGHAAPAVARSEHGHDIHWSYEGEGGPQAWGQLKPDFRTCGTGKRQSPIHIEDSITLQGPAEPIQFNYQPSSGTVINNGHTIQVDVYGDNFITVRGSTYKLIQFHFHYPSEERINYKSYAMVAHLVHRNPEGQLAVVAVLLDPGVANSLVNQVWTYMPLDAGDKVRMPDGLLDLKELLPQDQRYYQFLGSLTTPPCSEGVLWMVLKQPVTLSREQIKLFGQLFPNNARPLQPVNGRPIRDAQ